VKHTPPDQHAAPNAPSSPTASTQQLVYSTLFDGSKLELMRELTLRQSPRRCKVLGQILRLLHSGENGLVDLLLVRRPCLCDRFPFLLLSAEELLFRRLASFLRAGGEVRVGELVVELFYA